jgi:hypothetical protein
VTCHDRNYIKSPQIDSFGLRGFLVLGYISSLPLTLKFPNFNDLPFLREVSANWRRKGSKLHIYIYLTVNVLNLSIFAANKYLNQYERS